MTSKEQKPLFIILGAGRGGTSLLAGILDHHSEIDVGFEMFVDEYFLNEDVGSGDSVVMTGIPQPVLLPHARVDGFWTACRMESRKYPGKVWGNKITSEHLMHLELFAKERGYSGESVMDNFLRSGTADSRIIFIMRDGRSCVRSKVERTGQSYEIACSKWNYMVDTFKFIKARHPLTLSIKFEELLLNPDGVLRGICNFLNVPFEPAMVEGTMSEKMLPEYRRPNLDVSRAAVQNIPGQFAQLIDENLKYCGYIAS